MDSGKVGKAFYDRLKIVCDEHNTSVTSTLREIGRAEGNIGNWKNGRSPLLDIVIEIAEHFDITLDELVFGKKPDLTIDKLTDDEKDIVEIFNSIPAEKRQMCKDFLRTHIVDGGAQK